MVVVCERLPKLAHKLIAHVREAPQQPANPAAAPNPQNPPLDPWGGCNLVWHP